MLCYAMLRLLHDVRDWVNVRTNTWANHEHPRINAMPAGAAHTL